MAFPAADASVMIAARALLAVGIVVAGALIPAVSLAQDERPSRESASPPMAPVTGAVEARSVDPKLGARLSRTLERSLAESGAPGAQAAVILADGSTWTAGAGVSAPGQPMTPDLLMAIASVTKLYTAALTLDLASDGLLSLDDPLERWIPDAPHVGGGDDPPAADPHERHRQ